MHSIVKWALCHVSIYSFQFVNLKVTTLKFLLANSAKSWNVLNGTTLFLKKIHVRTMYVKIINF